jgi:hypothetical protein
VASRLARRRIVAVDVMAKEPPQIEARAFVSFCFVSVTGNVLRMKPDRHVDRLIRIGDLNE